VPLHCGEARLLMRGSARRLRHHAREALVGRARLLAALSRAPAAHLERQRRTLHQRLRELRAASRRRVGRERGELVRLVAALERGRAGARRDWTVRRRADLERMALALAAHDPQRTLARGYALVEDRAGGEPVTSAAAARAARHVRLRFADDAAAATIDEP